MTRRAAWPRHVRREHDSHAHRGCRAGRGFRTIIDGYGVPQVRAVATSAVREAGAEATAARTPRSFGRRARFHVQEHLQAEARRTAALARERRNRVSTRARASLNVSRTSHTGAPPATVDVTSPATARVPPSGCPGLICGWKEKPLAGPGIDDDLEPPDVVVAVDRVLPKGGEYGRSPHRPIA